MDEPFTMVVLIVLIAVGAGVINNYFKLRMESGSNDVADAEIQSLRQEVSKLTRRVADLEKIATDPEATLSREINRL